MHRDQGTSAWNHQDITTQHINPINLNRKGISVIFGWNKKQRRNQEQELLVKGWFLWWIIFDLSSYQSLKRCEIGSHKVSWNLDWWPFIFMYSARQYSLLVALKMVYMANVDVDSWKISWWEISFLRCHLKSESRRREPFYKDWFSLKLCLRIVPLRLMELVKVICFFILEMKYFVSWKHSFCPKTFKPGCSRGGYRFQISW